MTDELLAYLLDDLSDERRAEVKRRLQVDPEWRQELERLRTCLGDGDADGDDRPETSAPDDLVDRTCCLVDSVCEQLGSTSPAFTQAEPCQGRSRWSMADLTVGAGVALIVASFLLPALRQGRDTSRVTACKHNLMTLGTALFDYADKNEDYLPPISPHENAGRYARRLVEAGVISPEQLTSSSVCPETRFADQIRARQVTFTFPTQEQLARAKGKLLIRFLRTMGGTYAYGIGHFDGEGNYQQVALKGTEFIPLLADEPTIDPRGVRSFNHGGEGQVVLTQDLSARYVRSCQIEEACRQKGRCNDHFYLNKRNEHAAGVDADDVVLLRSDYTPLGRLRPVNDSVAAGCSASPPLLLFVYGVGEENRRAVFQLTPAAR